MITEIRDRLDAYLVPSPDRNEYSARAAVREHAVADIALLLNEVDRLREQVARTPAQYRQDVRHIPHDGRDGV